MRIAHLDHVGPAGHALRDLVMFLPPGFTNVVLKEIDKQNGRVRVSETSPQKKSVSSRVSKRNVPVRGEAESPRTESAARRVIEAVRTLARKAEVRLKATLAGIIKILGIIVLFITPLVLTYFIIFRWNVRIDARIIAVGFVFIATMVVMCSIRTSNYQRPFASIQKMHARGYSGGDHSGGQEDRRDKTR